MALTKVGSIGIATGISLTGVTTTQDAKVGTGITLSPDGDGYYTGIVTATSYRGDVSNCTGVGQTNFIDAESLNVSGISTFGGAISGTTATFSGNITANGNIVGDNSTDISGINDVVATSLYTSDSIIHRGETADNTKIRFPADDTITAETNGSERLRITSDGIVVIGESSAPTALGLLHLYQASNDSYIYIQRGSGDASNSIGGIIWKNNSINLGQIVVNSDDQNDSNMVFKTTYDGSLTEAFRINNNSCLLLGHSASAGKSSLLQVTASGGNTADFSRYVASEYGPNLHFIKSRNATAGSHTIIQSGDHLGIINFRGSDGSDFRAAAEIGGYVDGTPGSSDMPGRLVFSTTSDGASSPTERLRIDSAGAVILSNTFNSNTDISPALCIGSSSFGRPGIIIRGNSTNKGDISFCDNSGTDSSSGVSVGLIRYDHDGDYMCLHTNDDERVRILSDGKVGINCTDPDSALELRSTAGSYEPIIKIANHNTGAYAGGIKFESKDSSTIYETAAIYGYGGSGSSDGILAFQTRGTERMRIDKDGEVFIGDGLGSTNRSTLLSISGSDQDPTGVWTQIGVYSSDSQAAGKGGSIGFGGQDGTTAKQQFAAIKGRKDNNTSGNYAGYMSFYTRPDGAVTAERMRITSDGNVAVGKYSGLGSGGTNGIEINGGSHYVMFVRQQNVASYMGRNTDTGTILSFLYNGTERGKVQTDGTIIAYQTSSDYRLKENAVAISDGITKLKQLKPYTFNFKETPSQTVQGFFAHEVQSIVPDAVSGTKDAVAEEDDPQRGITKGDIEPQQMDYAKLTPLLTAALQEAITKIEALETKVAALESA